jgi:hypothetical protein
MMNALREQSFFLTSSGFQSFGRLFLIMHGLVSNVGQTKFFDRFSFEIRISIVI